MDVSIFLARFLGFYLLIVGISMFLNASSFKNVVSNVADNPAILLLSGTLTLIMGILLVLIHNIWQWDWRLMITLIAWIALLKGVLRLIFPKVPLKFIKALAKNKTFYYIKTTVILVLGVSLCYFGFWV